MNVRTVSISKVALDPANVRTHDQRNLKAIEDSLRLFGQRKPIVVMKADDGFVVIAGNGTLEAARAIGWDEIAVAVVPEDWTSDEAAAYAIADNRTAELAAWDEAGLRGQLEELAASGWDTGLLGFDAVGDGDRAVEIIEDVAPEPPDEPTTKPGDLWLLGDHRLLCGDSTTTESFGRLMAGEKADLVFTDPPYNVNVQNAAGKTIKNDNMEDAQFREFMRSAYQRMAEATRPGGAIYVCHADSYGSIFCDEMVAAGFMLKQVLIWVKQRFVLSRQDYNWQHEPILYGWREGAAHTWTGPFNRSTVIDDDSDPESLKKSDLLAMVRDLYERSTIIREDSPTRSDDHPTMKPVRLVARLIVNNSITQDVVLDPFLGAGSTLIAAEQLGRKCYGLELDPAYCDVIVQRWENLTGGKAVLAE